MGNPYATENWLRKQLALREDRIRDLELALREAYEALAFDAVNNQSVFKVRKAIGAAIAAAAEVPGK